MGETYRNSFFREKNDPRWGGKDTFCFSVSSFRSGIRPEGGVESGGAEGGAGRERDGGGWKLRGWMEAAGDAGCV